MWMFKSFSGKEPSGLEGRTIDVGKTKAYVRNVIAEGGFSCVYNVNDALQPSKHYALKHIISNDEESLDLVMKEISVMNLLKGHPNVITLVAHTILDMGRRKEALLLMEFCEKSLVSALENRGAGYLEEKNILLIFRDVCNAVCAMHCQSPPIAHRDLKAENVLLGSDGTWKLCDFGSTSTNHKVFDKPEEMGIEEDNIRKHTTPAYRAPEMWDLFRREVINEKVDIWALGCLLYRICYLKSAFDGESKLQILNGNYQIPELPKYSASVTGLIKDLLDGSPNARPDIMQVWSRVNNLLPLELRKHLPDGSAAASAMKMSPSYSQDEGVHKRAQLIPRRTAPPPPSAQEQVHNASYQLKNETHHSATQDDSTGRGSIGSFWSTQHAKHSEVMEKKVHEQQKISTPKHNQSSHSRKGSSGLPRNDQEISAGRSSSGISKDFEINLFQEKGQAEKVSKTDNPLSFGNESFDNFVTTFDTSKLNTVNSTNLNKSRKNELEAELDHLKGQLKQTNLEKAEITGKYDKLSAICRSQRQEIQELKQALAATTPSPLTKNGSRSQCSRSHGSLMKMEGTILELQQGMVASNSSCGPESKTWNAFDGDQNIQISPSNNTHLVPGMTGNTRQNITSSGGPSRDIPGSNVGNFNKAPAVSQVSGSYALGNTSQRFYDGATKKIEGYQPAGWADFS